MTFWKSELTNIALCWRLERRDGVALGFTSHDRDLLVGGLTYRAAPGMVPSAVEEAEGFDADALDVAGSLSSDAISAGDLAAGRWDGASVRMFAVDWAAPDDILVLARGELGAVSIKGDAFSAELRGPAAVLDRAVVEETSPECRAELGDRRCRIDMAGRRRIARVVSADGEALTVDAAEPGADGWGSGMLRWIDGANSGLSDPITSSSGSVLVLREAPRFAATAGDRVEIVEGCDKRLETCAARFANAVNFRGEPHLPGNDLLTRYPGE